jgi:hypothetical protein
MTNKECPECKGWGYTEYDRDVPCSSGRGYVEEYVADCENCGGSGSIEYTEEDEDDEYMQYDPPSATTIAMYLILVATGAFTVLAIFAKELLS